MKLEITEKEGDAVEALLNKEIDFLMHCCNAQSVMGAGIAYQIKEKVPTAFAAYRANLQYCVEKNIDPMGSHSEAGNVINLIGQRGFGRGRRQVHYGHLFQAMRSALDNSRMQHKYICGLDKSRKVRIGLPRFMGCGLAGGDWEVVRELIEGAFAPFAEYIEVVIYELRG